MSDEHHVTVDISFDGPAISALIGENIAVGLNGFSGSIPAALKSLAADVDKHLSPKILDFFGREGRPPTAEEQIGLLRQLLVEREKKARQPGGMRG